MADNTHWNYRVMRRKESFSDDIFFGIYEVYYTNNVPISWTQNQASPCADSLTELNEAVEWLALALTKPVLDWHTGKEI